MDLLPAGAPLFNEKDIYWSLFCSHFQPGNVYAGQVLAKTSLEPWIFRARSGFFWRLGLQTLREDEKIWIGEWMIRRGVRAVGWWMGGRVWLRKMLSTIMLRTGKKVPGLIFGSENLAVGWQGCPGVEFGSWKLHLDTCLEPLVAGSWSNPYLF